MTFEWKIDWVTAKVDSRTKTRRIRKRCLGIPYIGTHTKVFPVREYDSRNGDIIPEKVNSYARQLSCDPKLIRIYIYPGAELETPKFHHIKSAAFGRPPVFNDRPSLMVTLMVEGGHMITLPAERFVVNFDETVTNPKVHITCFQEGGFLVYDGLKDYSASAIFNNDEQRQKYTAELFSSEDLPETEAA